nr:unnamed protein product [Digitaria exilis]
MSSSLAIVEKRPSPFPGGGGGCTGGVLFHLLDWHRRLARKRRLFSPRRLLPSSLRSSSSPRRLPCPPPSPPPAALAPRHAAGAADGPAPGVVARLMGLESWPAAPPRPQKQRKVEAPRPDDGDDSAVVLVLPTSRSRRHPAPAAAAPAAPAPTTARSHHGADLPARSPRRARLVDAAAAKLLESGVRASERSRTRLALAYACSSPQHRKDGCHSGALLQGSGLPGRMADDFLSRSESLLTPSTRVQAQQPPPVRPAETGCDTAAVSRRHEQQRSIDNAKVEASTSTVVLPRVDFADGNISKRSFAMDAKLKDSRVRNEIEQDVYSSATSLNNEPNQPSPTSVLEASFSNDASSLGSPVEKNEVKDLFVSTENKMEELFNLESDMVNLATSIDTRKTNAEETLHDNVKLSCSQNYLAHDSKFLESRLLSIGVAETISSAELLLGSSLYPLIIEMLENTMDMFGGGDYSDLTEDKKYEHTNFLFDCIVESLDSKFCNYGKCGYKASLKLPFSLSKDLLKCQVLEDISNWKESSGTALRQVSVKEVDQVTARWDASQVEAFDISIAIENDILETLVGEFALDLW